MTEKTDALYGIEVETLAGEKQRLDAYRGRVMLIVNTASKCSFTPQYAGLEALHQKHGAAGLSVLGFPCDQFAHQEPGDAEEIGAFCQRNYGVSFPMHAKIEVNGSGAHPLFQHLKSEAPGLLGSEAVKWNFTKFLVDRDGRVVERFAPQTRPEAIEDKIVSLLKTTD
ncbi:MAG TPA: glutathione peroxidase [Myxococcaceae bacterium]|nr:glutathione peroxidase [Myxococcaceae bacterium]